MIVNLVLILVSVSMVVALANSPPPLPPGLVFFAVVVVVGTVLWIFRRVIASAVRSRRSRKLDRSIAESSKRSAESEKKRHEAKQAAIAVLPPVQRMTARIETNNMSVSLYLQLSEQERQTIIQYGLDQVVLETYPRYEADDLRRMKLEGLQGIENIKGYSQEAILRREFRQQDEANWLERAKTEKVEVRLIDYMEYPFTRYFKTTPEAVQYAGKLKQILPKIKELVDQHATHQSS